MTQSKVITKRPIGEGWGGRDDESPSRNGVKGSILWNKLPNHFTSLCISKIKFRNGQ